MPLEIAKLSWDEIAAKPASPAAASLIDLPPLPRIAKGMSLLTNWISSLLHTPPRIGRDTCLFEFELRLPATLCRSHLYNAGRLDLHLASWLHAQPAEFDHTALREEGDSVILPGAAPLFTSHPLRLTLNFGPLGRTTSPLPQAPTIDWSHWCPGPASTRIRYRIRTRHEVACPQLAPVPTADAPLAHFLPLLTDPLYEIRHYAESTIQRRAAELLPLFTTAELNLVLLAATHLPQPSAELTAAIQRIERNTHNTLALLAPAPSTRFTRAARRLAEQRLRLCRRSAHALTVGAC